mgnify:CR=1 FL=1
MSAASLNTITLIGRIGRAPEEVHAGQESFARFSVATDDGYMDRSGQKVERTTWHSVTCGGKTADFCLRYIGKGSLVLVQGRVLVRAGAVGAEPRAPRWPAGRPEPWSATGRP